MALSNVWANWKAVKCTAFTSSSSPSWEHDTEEWIKEPKANMDAAEAALRELEGLK
jgi:hypothetical protein